MTFPKANLAWTDASGLARDDARNDAPDVVAHMRYCYWCGCRIYPANQIAVAHCGHWFCDHECKGAWDVEYWVHIDDEERYQS